MANPYMPDEQPIYQGGAFTNITDLAGKLGAQHDRNLDTGRITVNGRNVPWTSAIGGQYHGSVQDVAQAAGGRVERGADGSYQVYASKAAPTPAGGTPVTGNPQMTAQASPTNPLRTLAASTTPPGWQRESQGQTPAAQALGQHTMAGVPQQIADPPSSATPPGWQWQPTPTPAAIDLGQRIMGADNQVQAPTSALPEQPPAAGPAASYPNPADYGPQQFGMPAFNYQEQPIDYAALQQRAQMEAQMWADPALQQLRDAAATAQQRYGNETGYVKQDLSASIGDLRAGEAGREQRINDDMNRRGDAIYNSGIRYAGLAQQQAATVAQESKLTSKAQNSLQKLADNLGLTMQDITSKTRQLAGQQGEKAYLTLQQLADKAQTQQFDNRKLAWQMWQQGARMSLDQQKMANELWMSNQRIKSQDERAGADRALKLAIANGQLEQKYTEMYGQQAQKQTELMGQDELGNPTFAARKFAEEQADKMMQAAGYIRGADGTLVRSLNGQKFDLAAAESMSKQLGYVIGVDGKPLLDDAGEPVQTLEGAKFDWDKQKFTISEGNKVSYQGALLKLRQDQAISDAAYKQAQLEISQGNINIAMSKLLGQVLDPGSGIPMRDSNGNLVPVYESASGGNPYSAANTAWKGVMGDLGFLSDPYQRATMGRQQVQAATEAIVGRWLPQLSPAEQQSLKQYLKTQLGQ